jgi:peroxiredoxin
MSRRFVETVFPAIVLSSSLALNLVLTWKILGLRRESAGTAGPELRIGMQLPAIIASTNGTLQVVQLSDHRQPTVMYVYSENCSWCRRNLANISELASTKKEEYRFVGVQLADPNRLGVREPLAMPFPAFSTRWEYIRQLGLRGTPQTLVISEDGKLLKSWFGAYMAGTQQEVEDYFKCKLPGLDKPARPRV